MKQITILIAALVLTFAESYSADFDQKNDLSDYNQYSSLLSNNNDFSKTPNYVDVSNKGSENVSENTAGDDELNEESLQSEKVIESNDKESTDDLFDRSAGAMGIGIF